ncbi:MAG TPA: DUF4412 domain-containing protein [Thermoanaerobaculia bacterium]|nr:DUF4412 domain-containing protein [Thermoanaerobaculia bacterium]
MERPMQKTILALTAALAFAGAAAADTKLEMKSHTDAFQMMGQNQPARDSDVTFWIAPDRVVRDDGTGAFIYRGDQDKLYVVDHEQKSYSVLSLPVDFLALMPAEMRAQMEGFLQQMSLNATVTPTDETQEINGWSARRYDVSMANGMGMKIDSTVWATTEIDADLDAFKGLYAAMGSLQPGGQDAVAEMMKIEGVPVLTETTVSGMGSSFSSKDELLSASQAEPPAGTYEVPEGYTENEFNPMAQGQ